MIDTHRLAEVATTLVRRVSDPVQRLGAALRGQGEVHHADRLPGNGPVIVVANHRHRLDARVLAAHLPRAARHLDMADLTHDLRAQRAGRAPGRSWRAALDTLAAGEVLVLFPEGEPSPDTRLHKGRETLGWLLLAVEPLPVVPVLLDTRAARLEFGHPLDLGRHHGLDAGVAVTRAVARGLTDEVMTALAALGDLGYLDVYATTSRDQVRSLARRRRDERRERAEHRRVLEVQAAEQRRVEADAERRDLARRHARAATEAREHAARAAERDQQRRAEVDPTP